MYKRVGLRWDYYAYPLWDLDEGGDVNPREYPLSQELIKRLYKWVDSKNQGKDPYEIYISSGSAEERKIFEQEGIELWKCLCEELGSQYKVSYFSEYYGWLEDTSLLKN